MEEGVDGEETSEEIDSFWWRWRWRAAAVNLAFWASRRHADEASAEQKAGADGWGPMR